MLLLRLTRCLKGIWSRNRSCCWSRLQVVVAGVLLIRLALLLLLLLPQTGVNIGQPPSQRGPMRLCVSLRVVLPDLFMLMLRMALLWRRLLLQTNVWYVRSD